MVFLSTYYHICTNWKKLKLQYLKNNVTKNKKYSKKKSVSITNNYNLWQNKFKHYTSMLKYHTFKGINRYSERAQAFLDSMYLSRYYYASSTVNNDAEDEDENSIDEEEPVESIYSEPLPGEDAILLNPTEAELAERRFVGKVLFIGNKLNKSMDRAEKWQFKLDENLLKKLIPIKLSSNSFSKYLNKHYMLAIEIMYDKEFTHNKTLYLHYRKYRTYPSIFLPLVKSIFLSDDEETRLIEQLNRTDKEDISKEDILKYRKLNIYVQFISPQFQNVKFYYPKCDLLEERMNYNMYWDINNLYYKFIGFLVRSGKREKAEYILDNSLNFIKNLISCNPLFLFMRAIYNSQSIFEFNKQKRQNKTLLIPRIVPLNKRIRVAMRLVAKNVRSNTILRKMKKLKKYKINTSYILSNIFFSYFFKIGEIRKELKMNIKNAYKQKHLLKNIKSNTAFRGNRLLKFLGFRKINGYHISK